VDRITVAAHAKEAAWPLGDGPYFHCPRPGCEVVYFTAGGSRSLTKDEVKTRVTFKENAAPRPLCYCRQVTEEDVMAAIASGARTLEQVRDATGLGGGGHCRITNPSGRCCSRNYIPFIEAELAKAEGADAGAGRRSRGRARRARR
jgi:bacterioferritin-associated ferredoxin